MNEINKNAERGLLTVCIRCCQNFPNHAQKRSIWREMVHCIINMYTKNFACQTRMLTQVHMYVSQFF